MIVTIIKLMVIIHVTQFNQLNCGHQLTEEDINHDLEFFSLNRSFINSLKFGSPFLPRNLYDVNKLLKYQQGLDMDMTRDNLDDDYFSFTKLPHGLQQIILVPQLINPLSMSATAVQLVECASTRRGFTDPDLGTLNLDPQVYCQPLTGRFIPRLTCCPPRSPELVAARLLLFPAARGSQPAANYNVQAEARAFQTGNFNYGPSSVPVLELNWRSKRRPVQIPATGKIVYLIHGYQDNVNSSYWIRPVAHAWNARGATVLVLDWKFTARGDPFQTVADIRTLGAMIGYTIYTWKINRRSLVVGHSFGAQIVHEAAKFFRSKSGYKLKECTGLDPGGPLFDGGTPQIRLTKDDCQLVTIIHSGSAYTQYLTGVLTDRLGTVYKSGHCDFWINCGHDQGPRCTDPAFGHFFERESAALINQYPTCGHNRATLVYLSQLKHNCNFKSILCLNCGTETNQINYHPFNDCNIDPSKGSFGLLPPFHSCNNRMNVNFYVSTTDRYPYC